MGETNRFANLQDFTYDRERSLEGVKLELGEGRWISVRQAGGFHRRFQTELERRMLLANVAGLEDRTQAELVAARITLELAAELLVSGWGGFVDDDGEPIECAPDAALECLEQHPDLAELVIGFAYSRENYRRQAETKSD